MGVRLQIASRSSCLYIPGWSALEGQSTIDLRVLDSIRLRRDLEEINLTFARPAIIESRAIKCLTFMPSQKQWLGTVSLMTYPAPMSQMELKPLHSFHVQGLLRVLVTVKHGTRTMAARNVSR